MPYTEKQRALFHAVASDPEVADRNGISRRTGARLAGEADELTKEGRERKPVKKAFIDLRPVFGGRGT